MHVLEHGRCSVKEIAERTKIPAPSVRNAVKHMDCAGSLRKFGEGSVSYGVTRDCCIPMYVTIRDLEIGGMFVKEVTG